MNHRFPWPSFERWVHLFYKNLVYKRKFAAFGRNSFLSPFSEIVNMERIHIAENVKILHGAWIMALDSINGQQFSPRITIGENSYIGHHVTLSCVNKIAVGRDVTFGDNVYVADNEHSYGDISMNIMKQPLVTGEITIGDNTWVGKNSVIFGNVTIGHNVIIGANSVVSKDVPPFTVVAGSPARVVKTYDQGSSSWVVRKP